MIILIHGTGDDDSKAEQWMKWVAEIMRKHGEKVLVLPGVESSQQGMLNERAMEFFRDLHGETQNRRTAQQEVAALAPAVRRAIQTGGGELARTLNVQPRQEEAVVAELVNHQRREKGFATSGIKLRVGVASMCALAYYRRARDLKPIRIIGHSRGGSAAVGTHNVLTYYGIPCNHTLTLDPCHGAAKGGSSSPMQKDYYYKVWAGNLVNVPCVKNVSDMPGFMTCRPAIEVGAGGAASVVNHPKLTHIKHGHMGKLQAIPGDGAAKDARRKQLQASLVRETQRRTADVKEDLASFFHTATQRATSDHKDRLFIQSHVIAALTC